MPAVKKRLPGLANAGKLGDDLLDGLGLGGRTVNNGMAARERRACKRQPFAEATLFQVAREWERAGARHGKHPKNRNSLAAIMGVG